MNKSFNEVDIEGILDRTIHQGMTYYLVKWEGLGYENVEWIQTERLSSWMLIKEFERNYRRWLGFECIDVDCDEVKLIPKPDPPLIDLTDNNSQPSSSHSFPDCNVHIHKLKVEYIKNHRNNCGTIEYLVKWKGMDEIDDSWLTEEISTCFQDLVSDYWEKVINI